MESEEPATKVKHKKRGRPPKNKNTLGKQNIQFLLCYVPKKSDDISEQAANDLSTDDYFEKLMNEDENDVESVGVKPGTKRGRKKRKKSEEDQDWSPNSANNTKKTKVVKEEFSDGDENLEFLENDDYELIKNNKNPKVNKARTDMVESRVQAAKELGHVIKFQIPCENKGKQVKLEDYKLPMPLESYIKPPRPLVNSDLMEEMSRDKPTGCDHCPRRFVSDKHLVDHVVKFHCNHIACPFCFRAFPLEQSENFRKHMYRHEHVLQLTEPHECIHCGYNTLRYDFILD